MAQKKRYYSSNGMRPEYYAGYDARNRQELEDSGMIREDRSAIANLPQEVMFKAYPKGDYLRYDLDDTIKGVDVQMNDDVRKELTKVGKKYPEKY